MRKKTLRSLWLGALVGLAFLATGRPALADHDLVRIEEIMAGMGGDPTIQFVQLKMLAEGQNCQGTAGPVAMLGACPISGPGAELAFFDATDTLVAQFAFPGNTPVGGNGRAILIATPRYQALRGVPAPDFVMPPHIVPGSGKVCYRSRPGTLLQVRQCLSYGQFTGSTEGFGTPAPALPTTGVVSLVRIADGFDNAQTFVLRSPSIANNGEVTGTMASPTLAAATLPSSRSVQVGSVATAFATVINTGAPQSGCVIAPIDTIPAGFSFQTTDPATNQPVGSPNTPASIAGGAGTQTFVLAIAPTQPFGPTDVRLNFQCAASDPAPSVTGLDTLLVSAAAGPIPDIVALAATNPNTGIVHLAGAPATGAFAVATVNVGAAGAVTVSPDTGSVPLPVALFVCQTDPTSGTCLSSPAPSVTTSIGAGATPTFAIFEAAAGAIPFEPSQNRVFVRFRDAGGQIRGATSVAVTTQP
jgi:hypothetical protein